jgi:hypothetical protein
MYRTIMAIGLVMAGTTAASAYHYQAGDGINRRQWNQERRIEEGRRDGSLSPGEYARLRQEQYRIAAHERWARRDGVLTAYERYRLRRAQKHASRHIYHERHDGQLRRWGWHRPWPRRWW